MDETQKIHWKRLSIEAAAIVVSILLAFTIDAWWDNRQDRAEERELLKSLNVEFEANRDQADSIISYLDRDVQSVAMLMELRQDEILALPAEVVETIIGSLATPRTFDAVRGSIDSMIGSGKLGMLRDRELREALTKFVNVVDDAVEDADFLAQTSIQVWGEIAKHGGPWRSKISQLPVEECADPRPNKYCYIDDALGFLPAATSQDLLRLRNNTVLMGYVKQNIVSVVHYSAEIRQVETEVDSVLRLLKENL